MKPRTSEIGCFINAKEVRDGVQEVQEWYKKQLPESWIKHNIQFTKVFIEPYNETFAVFKDGFISSPHIKGNLVAGWYEVKPVLH